MRWTAVIPLDMETGAPLREALRLQYAHGPAAKFSTMSSHRHTATQYGRLRHHAAVRGSGIVDGAAGGFPTCEVA
jgi:hypothetical protein